MHIKIFNKIYILMIMSLVQFGSKQIKRKRLIILNKICKYINNNFNNNIKYLQVPVVIQVHQIEVEILINRIVIKVNNNKVEHIGG